MSQFQRDFARAKLASLPLEPFIPETTLLEETEEGDDSRSLLELHQDDDSSSASSASSTGTIVPSLSKRRFASKGFVQSDWRLTFVFSFSWFALVSIFLVNQHDLLGGYRIIYACFCFTDTFSAPARWMHSHGEITSARNFIWKTSEAQK